MAPRVPPILVPWPYDGRSSIPCPTRTPLLQTRTGPSPGPGLAWAALQTRSMQDGSAARNCAVGGQPRAVGSRPAGFWFGSPRAVVAGSTAAVTGCSVGGCKSPTNHVLGRQEVLGSRRCIVKRLGSTRSSCENPFVVEVTGPTTKALVALGAVVLQAVLSPNPWTIPCVLASVQQYSICCIALSPIHWVTGPWQHQYSCQRSAVCILCVTLAPSLGYDPVVEPPSRPNSQTQTQTASALAGACWKRAWVWVAALFLPQMHGNL